jgi:hypothetical protein
MGRMTGHKRLIQRVFIGLGCLAASWAMTGCGDSVEDIPLDDVTLDLQVIRLDQSLYECAVALQSDTTQTPQSLFRQYFQPSHGFITDWMFGGNDSMATDSMVGAVMRDFAGDPHGRVLVDTIHAVLGGVDVKAALENPLKRYKYYFPAKPTPVVAAFIDGFPPTAQRGIDQVYISPRYLGIGMHYFMGPDFQYYPPDLPRYVRRRCTPEHMPSLVVHEMAKLIVPDPDIRTNPVLVDYVICEGIRMTFVDKLLGPAVHDTLKLYYEASEMDWANLYEGRIYKDLVTDLYSADAALQLRYVDDSPFTSQLNRGSAPRLGQFIGWKIVLAYLKKHPETTLDGLVQMTDYQKIFKESGYRPPKEE